ncbi:MAG: hypothetical protein QNJ54_14550 [Prochloraceae cyanobacterium]|nr:hypothetical protein [Prochloraceae cyanobacterium]
MKKCDEKQYLAIICNEYIDKLQAIVTCHQWRFIEKILVIVGLGRVGQRVAGFLPNIWV